MFAYLLASALNTQIKDSNAAIVTQTDTGRCIAIGTSLTCEYPGSEYGVTIVHQGVTYIVTHRDLAQTIEHQE